MAALCLVAMEMGRLVHQDETDWWFAVMLRGAWAIGAPTELKGERAELRREHRITMALPINTFWRQ